MRILKTSFRLDSADAGHTTVFNTHAGLETEAKKYFFTIASLLPH